MNLYIWIAVSVISFGIYCYLLGRGKIEFRDDNDSQLHSWCSLHVLRGHLQ